MGTYFLIGFPGILFDNHNFLSLLICIIAGTKWYLHFLIEIYQHGYDIKLCDQKLKKETSLILINILQVLVITHYMCSIVRYSISNRHRYFSIGKKRLNLNKNKEMFA